MGASKPSRVGLACAILLAPVPALAGPPFTTDDPEPVDLHHAEIYLASQLSSDAGDLSGTAPQLELNYGAAPDLQLHLLAPLAFTRPRGGPVRFGYGDTELGVKLRFVQEGRWVPQLGTFPLVELPTGSSARGLGAGHLQAFVPVWLQKSIGKWTSYGWGGYWVNPGPGNRDFAFLGWELQRQLTHALALGAEVFHTTPKRRGESSETRANLGLILDVTEHHHLIGSFGPAFGAPTRLQGYLAYLATIGA